MKKILSLVLAALMVFSMVPAIFASDVTLIASNPGEETSEYDDAIQFLAMLGIYTGTSTEAFVAAANDPVNRAMMAMFVARLITGQVENSYWATAENNTEFTDVNDCEDYFLGAISFASAKGIVNGVGDNLFDPETGVQYREAITMIVRALGYTFKASGYPWSYINKAMELGLLDGISGIAYTDEINRGVVAQLLYNALFAEIDGTTMAAKAFKVGKTEVLITASNAVSYTDESVVTRNGYVRFSEMDEQGEPTGAAYHVDMAQFGLADATAANAAVGTAYAVYYKNSCAEILAAESLTSKVENRSNNGNVSFDGKKTLTINGSKFEIVSAYTALNNAQGTIYGNNEVKVYETHGAATIGWNSEYIIDSFNNVYTVDATGTPVLYATYSAVLDCYYKTTQDANGKYSYEIVSLEDILLKAGKTTGAFKQVTSINGKLAYADFILTDNNNDGTIDRVAVQQYGFGQISFGKNSDKKDIFTVKAVADETNSVNTLANTVVNAALVSGYRWTGLQQSDIANGAYVLYYVDTDNKEINVLQVLDSVSGYLSGYNAASDTIIMRDGTTYTIGYDSLYGSPLKTKGNKNANLSNNVTILNNYFTANTNYTPYVTLIMLDNKVVHITNGSVIDDYVIIDSYTGFDAEGIHANVYTTVNDTYTEIVIGAYNGWSVGGFDWNYYYLAGILGNMTGTGTNSYASVLPFSLKTLYKVHTVDANGVYNLTDASSTNTNKNLTVNAYGFIEGTDGKGTVADGKYVATATNDYWLILDLDLANNGQNKAVYAVPGKMSPIVKITNATVYKASANDYVMTVNNASDITGINNVAGKTTSFVMYSTGYNQVEHSSLIQYVNYEWKVLMTDVLTGSTSYVSIDNSLVQNNTNGWTGSSFGVGVANILTAGSIYQVIDGKIYSLTTYNFADVANYYNNNSTVVENFAAGATYDSVRTFVAGKLAAQLYPNGSFANNAALISSLTGKVDVIIDNNGVISKNNKTAVNALLATANHNFNVYYYLKSDGTAVAWIDGGSWNGNATGTLALRAAKSGVGVNYSNYANATDLPDCNPVASYEYNYATQTLVVTINFAGVADPVTAADSTAVVYADVAGDQDVTPVVENGKITSLVATYTNVTVDTVNVINVQINRTTGNSLFFNFAN